MMSLTLSEESGRNMASRGVTIRNDNGSQFIADSVKEYLRSAEANQEFTHIATSEENSYIEAFHSIVQREVIERFEFDCFYPANIPWPHTGTGMITEGHIEALE